MSTRGNSDGNSEASVLPKHGRGRLLPGGKKGNRGGGRTPDAFKEEMRRLVSRKQALDKLQSVLDDPEHPQWMAAYKFAAEQGYGKAPQSVELTGKDGAPLFKSYIGFDPENDL